MKTQNQQKSKQEYSINFLIVFSVSVLLFIGCKVADAPQHGRTSSAASGAPQPYYLPTKESVPNISRYKARLLFEDAINKSINNFSWQNHWQGGKWWYKLNALEAPQITDSTFSFVFSDEYTKETKRYKFTYSDLDIYALKYSAKKGVEIGFPFKKWEKLWIVGAGYTEGKNILDALYILKFKDQNAEDKKELESFKPIAEQYKALATKPQLNERARKYLVQATNATEEKRYSDGIDLLEKALAVDPTYPLAHFNRALLWGQVSAFCITAEWLFARG